MRKMVERPQIAGVDDGPVSARLPMRPPVLDPAVFDALWDMLDQAVIAQIYGEFLTQTRLRLNSLAAMPEPEKLKDAGHTLKGTAGMLGAGELAACAERLEHAPADKAGSLIQQIRQSCDALQSALTSRQVAL